jgi:hypothetical protein
MVLPGKDRRLQRPRLVSGAATGDGWTRDAGGALAAVTGVALPTLNGVWVGEVGVAGTSGLPRRESSAVSGAVSPRHGVVSDCGQRWKMRPPN